MLRPVPTGTVDFITSAWWSDGGMESTTAWTAERSASPEYSGGVPTATKSSRACSSASGRCVEKCRRPWCLATISSSPGSQIRITPGFPGREPGRLGALDLGLVHVDAPDPRAELREAGPRHEPDVARPDDAD